MKAARTGIIFLLALSFGFAAGAESRKPAQKAAAQKPRALPPKKKPSAPITDNLASDTPQVVIPEARPTGGRWTLGLVYSMADKVKYQGTTTLLTGPTDFAATDNTHAAFGLAAGYISRTPWWFGFSGELVYEMPRGSSGIDARAGTTTFRGTYEGDPKTSLLTAHVNGNYMIGSNVYVFAGLNYPFALTSSDAAKLTGLLGRQYGLGVNFLDHYSIELCQRLVGMKGTIVNNALTVQVEEANLEGLLATFRYDF